MRQPVNPSAKQVARIIRRHSHAPWSRPIREAKTVTEAARLLPALLDALKKQIETTTLAPGLTDDELTTEVLFERSLRSEEEQENWWKETRRLAKLLKVEEN